MSPLSQERDRSLRGLRPWRALADASQLSLLIKSLYLGHRIIRGLRGKASRSLPLGGAFLHYWAEKVDLTVDLTKRGDLC